jgi:hypothetical protein
MPKFGTKALNKGNLATPSGWSDFNSMLIELWIASRFAREGLPVICDPKVESGQNADFKVNVNGGGVYFEVRNLEEQEWVKTDSSSNEAPKWTRTRLNLLYIIISQSWPQFPYPYHVELQPYNLSGNKKDFEADIYLAIEELRIYFKNLPQFQEELSKRNILLPKDKPRVRILGIQKWSCLNYALIGWGEYSKNPLRILADRARSKLRDKGRQLAPDAPNVLVVGLPIGVGQLSPRTFAEELLGPLELEEEAQQTFRVNGSRIDELGQKIKERTSAFLIFLPADRAKFYPGWVQVVRNPLGWTRNPLPESVEEILLDLPKG